MYITDKNFSINKEKNQKEKKLTNMKLNNEYCKNCKHYFVDDSYHGVFEDRCRLG